jgi:hypothetical protein
MTLFNSLVAKLFVQTAFASDSFMDYLKPPLDISKEGHRIDSLFNLTT